MRAEISTRLPGLWKYLTSMLFNNFCTRDSRSFHSTTWYVVGANSPGRNFGQGRLITHLLCCRRTIIHEHNCGDNIDQQSNYGQSVWCDPCRRLLNKPVPVDLTRRLEQGSARGAVFVLLQPLELSWWQRLWPQEMWHVFPCFQQSQSSDQGDKFPVIPKNVQIGQTVSSRPSPKIVLFIWPSWLTVLRPFPERNHESSIMCTFLVGLRLDRNRKWLWSGGTGLFLISQGT